MRQKISVTKKASPLDHLLAQIAGAHSEVESSGGEATSSLPRKTTVASPPNVKRVAGSPAGRRQRRSEASAADASVPVSIALSWTEPALTQPFSTRALEIMARMRPLPSHVRACAEAARYPARSREAQRDRRGVSSPGARRSPSTSRLQTRRSTTSASRSPSSRADRRRRSVPST